MDYKTVAEFKNDQWRKLNDLTQGRKNHGSIAVGLRIMIVGGYTYGYNFGLVWTRNKFIIIFKVPDLISKIQECGHGGMGIGRRNE